MLLARLALLAASIAAAFASARLALACAKSAEIVPDANRANICPRLTLSPTFTNTSFSNKPFTSAPTTASCHGAIFPFAGIITLSMLRLILTVLTVSAALVFVV